MCNHLYSTHSGWIQNKHFYASTENNRSRCYKQGNVFEGLKIYFTVWAYATLPKTFGNKYLLPTSFTGKINGKSTLFTFQNSNTLSFSFLGSAGWSALKFPFVQFRRISPENVNHIKRPKAMFAPYRTRLITGTGVHKATQRRNLRGKGRSLYDNHVCCKKVVKIT